MYCIISCSFSGTFALFVTIKTQAQLQRHVFVGTNLMAKYNFLDRRQSPFLLELPFAYCFSDIISHATGCVGLKSVEDILETTCSHQLHASYQDATD